MKLRALSVIAALVATPFVLYALFKPTITGPQGAELCKAFQANFGSLGVLTYSGAGPFTVTESQDFKNWFPPQNNGKVPPEKCDSGDVFMGYFVRCAFGNGIEVKSTLGGPWYGQYGLAAKSLQNKASMSADERKWVSACLLAHVNAKHLVQHISLRGLPLAVEPGERFAEGYPEGVFFGDLWEGTPGSGGARYAMSLNLPSNYAYKQGNWWPPNSVLGRTLDYLSGGGDVNYRGRCLDDAARFGPGFAGTPPPSEPTHTNEWICPEGAYDAATKLCGPQGLTAYHPLFVYGPYFATLHDLSSAATSSRVQLIGTVADAKDCSPKRPDKNPDANGEDRRSACIVATDPLKPAGAPCHWENEWQPSAPVPPDRTARYFTLGKNNRLQAIRRAAGGEPADGTAFTAIIRVMAKPGYPKTAKTALFVSREAIANPPGAEALAVPWTTLAGKNSDPEKELAKAYTWLEVYPIYLGKENGTGPLSLSLHFAGSKDGGEMLINAVGFTPGKPWCCEGRSPAAWCGNTANWTELRAGLCHKEVPPTVATH